MRARAIGERSLVATAVGAVAVVLAATVGLLACDPGTEDEGSRPVNVLTAMIRDVVADQPPPDPTTALPVVYVVGIGEEGVAATVQADVASQLHDEVDVRFADAREEAIKADEDGQPVPDSGVLLVVGDIPVDGNSIEVPIEIYRSQIDWSKMVVTVTQRSSNWQVTETSQVSLDVS